MHTTKQILSMNYKIYKYININLKISLNQVHKHYCNELIRKIRTKEIISMI